MVSLKRNRQAPGKTNQEKPRKTHMTNIVSENGEFKKIARNVKITQTDKKSL